MAEARDRAAWNRTFAGLAQLYNIYRPEGAERVSPLAFFPWESPEPPQAPPPTEEDRVVLRELFPGRK